MSIVPIYVGLDYHQKFVQVCVLDKAGRAAGQSGGRERRRGDSRRHVPARRAAAESPSKLAAGRRTSPRSWRSATDCPCSSPTPATSTA